MNTKKLYGGTKFYKKEKQTVADCSSQQCKSGGSSLQGGRLNQEVNMNTLCRDKWLDRILALQTVKLSRPESKQTCGVSHTFYCYRSLLKGLHQSKLYTETKRKWNRIIFVWKKVETKTNFEKT